MSSPTRIETKHNRLQHPWYKQLCSQRHSLHTPQSPPPTRLLQRSIQGWEGLEVKETSVSVGKRRPLLKADQASAHKYSVFFKIWWYTCSSVWVSAMLRQVVLSGGSAMLKTTLPWVHANFTRQLCVCFHIEAYWEMIDIFSGTIPQHSTEGHIYGFLFTPDKCCFLPFSSQVFRLPQRISPETNETQGLYIQRERDDHVLKSRNGKSALPPPFAHCKQYIEI